MSPQNGITRKAAAATTPNPANLRSLRPGTKRGGGSAAVTVSSGVGAMPNCLPSTGSVGVIAGKCRKPSLQSWLSWPATKELVVSKPWWLGAGSAFRLRVVSTQPFAGAHVLAQPALLFPELVVSKPLVHVWGFGVGFWLFGCGVVSTRVARSSRPGSTSFEETVSFVATPETRPSRPRIAEEKRFNVVW